MVLRDSGESLRYTMNYDNNSPGRLFGYKNELLTDYPMVMYGEDSDGEVLSGGTIELLLGTPLTPYPDLYPYF